MSTPIALSLAQSWHTWSPWGCWRRIDPAGREPWKKRWKRQQYCLFFAANEWSMSSLSNWQLA